MKSAFLDELSTKEELARFIIEARRLSMSDKCAEFESAFAEYQGRRHAILFNSGGSANLALFQALRNVGLLNVGGHVAFSALTWATNVMPIIQMGMHPIVVDCTPATLNVMSNDLLQRLDSCSVDALFLTNAMGLTGDLQAIRNLCEARQILLIEDNCEALGSELPEGRAGNFGLAATFSFFVAHHMSTVEGGMVCTNDDVLAQMLRMVRANGWDRNLSPREQHQWRKAYGIESEFEAKYTFYELAFNFRPTEITGFLGLSQLRHLQANVLRREQNFLRLQEIVRQNPDLITLEHDHMRLVSSFAFPVLCRSAELRDRYLAQFAGAGVEIRPMIAGNIQKQPFFAKYVDSVFECPGADFIHACGFYCGNYPELTETDLDTITSCLQRY